MTFLMQNTVACSFLDSQFSNHVFTSEILLPVFFLSFLVLIGCDFGTTSVSGFILFFLFLFQGNTGLQLA